MSEEQLEKMINGIGQRLNDLVVCEASCKAKTNQRLETLEKRQDDQRGDIKELFTAVDKVRIAVSSLTGRIIGAAAVLAILIPIVTSILQEFVFKK